jgi:plasmid maintenance system antidote protein VapI
MWLRLQTAHDLAQTRVHADRINVQRYEPLQPLPRQPVLGA